MRETGYGRTNKTQYFNAKHRRNTATMRNNAFDYKAPGPIKKLSLKITSGLNMNKPRLMVHSGINHVKGRLGLRVPRQIHIALTNKCNLNCEHCFASHLDQGADKQLTHGDLANIYAQGLRMGVYGYHFTGGEPLMRSDLEDVLRIFHPHRTYLSFITNSSMLTRERIQGFKKIGVDCIAISLDSGFSEEHDRFRGSQGLFDNAIECFRMLHEEGIHPITCITVTDDTVREPGFLTLVDKMRDLNVEVHVNYGVRIGNWESNQNVFFSPDSKRFLLELISKNPHVFREEMFTYREWGCPAMKELIYITAFGDVIPCPYIHISFGNIRQEPLMDIWKRALSFRMFSSYAPLCLSGEDPLFTEKIIPLTWVDTPPVPYKAIEKELRELDSQYE